MKMQIYIADAQMELALANQLNAGSPDRPRTNRRQRARWWFDRMRQVVERAVDWPACPPPRPEQIWFPK